jgi:hypothetical protein
MGHGRDGHGTMPDAAQPGRSMYRRLPTWYKLRTMLFMVIERFKPGSQALIGERFKRNDRMLPDGVAYHASWVEPNGTRCFQIMEAASPELLQAWADRWFDLVDFEIIPVQTSVEFWEKAKS